MHTKTTDRKLGTKMKNIVPIIAVTLAFGIPLHGAMAQTAAGNDVYAPADLEQRLATGVSLQQPETPDAPDAPDAPAPSAAPQYAPAGLTEPTQQNGPQNAPAYQQPSQQYGQPQYQQPQYQQQQYGQQQFYGNAPYGAYPPNFSPYNNFPNGYGYPSPYGYGQGMPFGNNIGGYPFNNGGYGAPYSNIPSGSSPFFGGNSPFGFW